MEGGIRMKLLFKQRFFSWFDSYDIYDQNGNTVYVIKGELSWGHRLQIYDAYGNHLGTVQERVLTWLPKFELYVGDRLAGVLTKEFSFLRPKFNLDCNGWRVEGSFMEWDYTISSASRGHVATVGKELFHWTDTYVIDVADPSNALCALMIVLAIDAEKCSRQ